MLSLAPQLPESHYQNCQNASNAAREALEHLAAMRSMHKSIDGETTNEEGIQSVRPSPRGHRLQPARWPNRINLYCKFLAKFVSTLRCSMRWLLSALHYATLTSPFPRPSACTFDFNDSRSIALTRLDGPADARTRTDMPTPSKFLPSLCPSFASVQTTCC